MRPASRISSCWYESGISSCWYEGDTCDMHLEKLAAEVTALR